MIVAHFSDPHLVAPFSWKEIRQYFGELNFGTRGLAFLNWFFRRRREQHLDRWHLALREIIERRGEVVLLTGDLTQVAREIDYEFFYEQILPLRRAKIPVLAIAGNHDFYRQLPAEHFAQLRVDLSLDLHWHGEPVRLNKIDLLPLTGAVRTPMLQAWGKITDEEIAGIQTAWRMLPKSSGQARIAAGHFPVCDAANNFLPPAIALKGAEKVLELFAAAEISDYFCGHLHRAFSLSLTEKTTQHCAGSLTLNENGEVKFYEF